MHEYGDTGREGEVQGGVLKSLGGDAMHAETNAAAPLANIAHRAPATVTRAASGSMGFDHTYRAQLNDPLPFEPDLDLDGLCAPGVVYSVCIQFTRITQCQRAVVQLLTGLLRHSTHT